MLKEIFNKKEYDAIIVGGGLAGLSIGALLSKKNYKILVLEKDEILGGRAKSYEKDGYIYEYGLHTLRLHKDGIAYKLFKELGLDIEFANDRDHTSYLLFNGKLYKRPSSPIDFILTKAVSIKNRGKLIKFLLKIKKADPEKWWDYSFRDFYLSCCESSSEIEQFISFLSFTIMQPDINIASAGEVIDFIQRALKSKIKVGEPKRGSLQLIEKLKDYIEQNGGTILTGKEVKKILTRKKKVFGVRTKRERYFSKVVIYAAPIQNIDKILNPNELSKKLLLKIKNIEFSSGLEIHFYHRKGELKSFDGKIILEALKGSIMGIDFPIYIKVPSSYDKSWTPEDIALSSWLIMVPNNLKENMLSEYERKIKNLANQIFPGFSETILKERKIFAPIMNGAMLKVGQSRKDRIHFKSEDIKGLFFIGDTTSGDGVSSDIAFSSALKALPLVIQEIESGNRIS